MKKNLKLLTVFLGVCLLLAPSGTWAEINVNGYMGTSEWGSDMKVENVSDSKYEVEKIGLRVEQNTSNPAQGNVFVGVSSDFSMPDGRVYDGYHIQTGDLALKFGNDDNIFDAALRFSWTWDGTTADNGVSEFSLSSAKLITWDRQTQASDWEGVMTHWGNSPEADPFRAITTDANVTDLDLEVGGDTRFAFGYESTPDWEWKQITAGAHTGVYPGGQWVREDSVWSEHTLEGKFDLALLTAAGYQLGDELTLKWTMQCGNDWAEISTHTDPGTPVIPEPATMLLMGTGLIGIAGLRRRTLKA